MRMRFVPLPALSAALYPVPLTRPIALTCAFSFPLPPLLPCRSLCPLSLCPSAAMSLLWTEARSSSCLPGTGRTQTTGRPHAWQSDTSPVSHCAHGRVDCHFVQLRLSLHAGVVPHPVHAFLYPCPSACPALLALSLTSPAPPLLLPCFCPCVPMSLGRA